MTLLGDEYQQIYGEWALYGSSTDTTSLLQQVDRERAEFKRIELNKIHRTDSPELLHLIDELRLDL